MTIGMHAEEVMDVKFNTICVLIEGNGFSPEFLGFQAMPDAPIASVDSVGDAVVRRRFAPHYTHQFSGNPDKHCHKVMGAINMTTQLFLFLLKLLSFLYLVFFFGESAGDHLLRG
ncbi:hypothetical protein F0562_019324 [Nyssa sinensis]|uniref:Uncharacterized protein n=1 Tax=Nyssa sinensis TaxID=561372 RepID=A0A5J4ZC10_9ASTE|nr:hypothetical protein F0562_019324 [Nyssa sinensis]